jgi:thioredoxin 1
MSNSPNVTEATDATFAQILKEANDAGKPVLIDLYASWCPPCKAMAPVLDQFADANTDVKVVKVDVEKNPSLSQFFQIRSIPVLAVFTQGRFIVNKPGALLQTAQMTAFINAATQQATEMNKAAAATKRLPDQKPPQP